MPMDESISPASREQLSLPVELLWGSFSRKPNLMALNTTLDLTGSAAREIKETLARWMQLEFSTYRSERFGVIVTEVLLDLVHPDGEKLALYQEFRRAEGLPYLKPVQLEYVVFHWLLDLTVVLHLMGSAKTHRF